MCKIKREEDIEEERGKEKGGDERGKWRDFWTTNKIVRNHRTISFQRILSPFTAHRIQSHTIVSAKTAAFLRAQSIMAVICRYITSDDVTMFPLASLSSQDFSLLKQYLFCV